MADPGADHEFRSGDWVQVYAQVYPTQLGPPENITLDFFSRSEQWHGMVLRDRVVPCDPPPGIAGRCDHLGEFTLDDDAEYLLKRCTSHHGHAGPHRARAFSEDREWESKMSAGYFEER